MTDFRGERAATELPCKCCGAQARLVGVVDFSRSCQDSQAGRKIEPYSGWPIYYYLCGNCELIFTPAFDHWTPAQFSANIYNDGYILHDPDYKSVRPAYTAGLVESVCGQDHRHLTILDYGSGSGEMANILRSRGFANVSAYDPFSSPDIPVGKFDLITCFEVFEHSANPRALVRDIAHRLADGGGVLFSTLTYGEEVIRGGVANWWYCGPRNGHITFFSRKTLQFLANEAGFAYAWFDQGRHLFFRGRPPRFLEHFFPSGALA